MPPYLCPWGSQWRFGHLENPTTKKGLFFADVVMKVDHKGLVPPDAEVTYPSPARDGRYVSSKEVQITEDRWRELSNK
jgi:hypothetical protein